MSGWWLRSSAIPATTLTNAIAAAKSANSKSRTIASPSRRHCEPSSRCGDLVVVEQSHGSSIPPMRIVSLVPHATELLFALGLGDDVVAVTHECDHPARGARAATRHAGRLPAGPVGRRDRRGRARRSVGGRGDLRARHRAAARARARPDRHPGAVPRLRGHLRRGASRRPSRSTVVPEGHRARPQDDRRDDGRHPHDRRGDRARATPRWTSSRASARASTACALAVKGADRPRGRGDRVVRPGVRRRPLDAAADRARRRPRRARLRRASTPSRRPGRSSRPRSPRSSSACRAATTRTRSLQEAEQFAGELRSLGARRVVAVDAAAYFSRPGPRLVDGLELLAHVLHPDRVELPDGRVRSARGRALSRTAHRPLPAFLERPLRRRPPARAARHRAGPRALPAAGRAARPRRAGRRRCAMRASRCRCGRWRCCAAR